MMRPIFARLAGLFRRRRLDEALDDEVRAHLDLLAADYERRGLSPDEARLAARRTFGGVEGMKERYRDQRGFRWFQDFARDLRYGVRTMVRHPGLSIVAAVTLALGIGANTALFSVIDALLLKPLPVTRPDELRLITLAQPEGVPRTSFSYPFYEDLQRRVPAFSGIALFGGVNRMRMGAAPEIETLYGQAVSGNFFSVLGVLPVAGRILQPDDDRRESANAVVLSDAFWSRRFGRDPSVIGRAIVINELPFTVVGVAAERFAGVEVGTRPDLWWPIQAFPRLGMPATFLTLRGVRSWRLMGRLAPGADPRQAEAQVNVAFDLDRQDELARTAAQLGGIVPAADRARILAGTMRLEPVRAGFTLLRWQFRRPLIVLMGLVALVLLIACANVASLLLARATARRQEIAVRMALGSGRGRLIRQLLTESLLLAGVGAMVGVAVAVAGIRLVITFLNAEDVAISAGPDLRVLAFTFAVSLLAALVAGLIPALTATRLDLARRDGRDAVGRRGLTLHHAIIGAQVALSIVVLVTGGLFVRTLTNLRQIDTGFTPENLTLVSLQVPSSAAPDGRLAVYRNVLDRLAAIPDSRAALSLFGVLSGMGWSDRVAVGGKVERPDENQIAFGVLVSSAFFDVAGTRIVEGRGFGPEHDRPGDHVAVVSETMARQFFGGSPVGRRFAPFPGEMFTVIGVAADSTYRSVREEADAARPIMYLPALQGPATTMAAQMGDVQIAIRAGADTEAVAAGVREAVREVGPGLIVTEVRSMAAVIDDTFARERLLAELGAAFGVLSLVLGAIGLYGVRSYAVSRRTAEFGVRLALGATPGQVSRLVMRQGAVLVMTGLAVGLFAAAAATRVVRTLLFEVTPLDLPTFAAAAALFTTVAIVASYLPARRATRVNPLVALRSE